MAFDAVARDLDLVALEERVLESWRRDDVFRESLRRRQGAPEWVFYEGPPTANGRPGIHHAWGRIFKDLYPRFQTMRGHYVSRKGGWDCHGLPVELEVEKELGFTGKHDIEEFGIAEFNQRCRESVHRYVEDWSALTTRVGMWIDTEDAYWTLDNTYVESVWWHLKQMWDKGLIYEGFKVVPYCGRCGTALSSHEVALGYEDVTEASVYVRFPVVDADFDLLVWTTTPWTLLSNVGAAVGPEIEYARVSSGDGRRDLVLAAHLVHAVLGDDVQVVERMNAGSLVGLRYERPFDLVPVDPGVDAFRVVADDFVTIEEGTGIVHLAPAFGEIDREIGEREGLPLLNPVDNTAHFDTSVGPYSSRFVKDADHDIIDALAQSGRLEMVVDYTHSYPHCWRCDTPLIYWAKPTWFAATSTQVDALLRENEAIDWHPEHIKHGRFGDWLANNIDWALSRDRFWGTPLPFWRCEACKHDVCVGSVAELAELAGRDLGDLDLHRPAVDDVAIACPECSGRARRVDAVLDAWFDSGSMPASQLHYPFEQVDTFEKRFPADFICEAIDQTRGWFYSLLAVNTLVFGRAPFRHVVCHAHIIDRDGQKMSKSRGNVLDPWSILNTRGADALRWYLVSAGSPWTNRRVYDEGIEESTRRFILTLWNTYSFFVTYANLDGWAPVAPAEAATHVLDRWARSRLHSTVRDVTDALESYDALGAAQALERMVDDLSNWYVRRGRARFWKSTDPAAHATLHECLLTVATMLAPVCPFVSDEIYRNLAGATDSVHLTEWPSVDEQAIDAGLEAAVARARDLVTLGRAARAEAKLKVRQPLPRALLVLPDDVELSEALLAEIGDELNVKQLERVAGLEGLLDEHVVPNFRRLGPKAGRHMPRVKQMLGEIDIAALRAAFDAGGTFELAVDGDALTIEPDDVEIRASAHQELALARDGAIAVALDTTIDDALRREGVARELVRVINDLRRTKDFDLADRIQVLIYADGVNRTAIEEHRDWVAGEVLASSLELRALADAADDADGLDLETGRVVITLQRA